MFCKCVEVYLQSLVTTNVFLGLQTFHLETQKTDNGNQPCPQLGTDTSV